jgi:hypothetical protein
MNSHESSNPARRLKAVRLEGFKFARKKFIIPARLGRPHKQVEDRAQPDARPFSARWNAWGEHKVCAWRVKTVATRPAGTPVEFPRER